MNDLIEVAAEQLCNNLHGVNGVTEKIKRAMYESAKQFVYIGFLLKEVRDYKYYEEGGYESVYQYAEFELGFKKSSTKNFIAIAETFGSYEYKYEGITTKTTSMNLQPAYEKFNYSQLVELLAMSPEQRKQANPDMSVRKLREIKKTPTTPSQTSGQIEVIKAESQWLNLGHEVSQKGKTISPGLMITLCERANMTYELNKRYRIYIKELP